ncbi:MAG TPA: YqgQ family protein [Virgibacillus sp.]|nr:YqgQ family protein [Virgibacillus sp.]
MKTMFDVQQLLKRFGIFIYTGDRLSDLELMGIEIDALHESTLLTHNEYMLAKLILKKEITVMQQHKG